MNPRQKSISICVAFSIMLTVAIVLDARCQTSPLPMSPRFSANKKVPGKNTTPSQSRDIFQSAGNDYPESPSHDQASLMPNNAPTDIDSSSARVLAGDNARRAFEENGKQVQHQRAQNFEDDPPVGYTYRPEKGDLSQDYLTTVANQLDMDHTRWKDEDTLKLRMELLAAYEKRAEFSKATKQIIMIINAIRPEVSPTLRMTQMEISFRQRRVQEGRPDPGPDIAHDWFLNAIGGNFDRWALGINRANQRQVMQHGF